MTLYNVAEWCFVLKLWTWSSNNQTQLWLQHFQSWHNIVQTAKFYALLLIDRTVFVKLVWLHKPTIRTYTRICCRGQTVAFVIKLMCFTADLNFCLNGSDFSTCPLSILLTIMINSPLMSRAACLYRHFVCETKECLHTETVVCLGNRL